LIEYFRRCIIPFMPPSAVKTVKDLIFWQYAKIIAKSAGFYGDKPQYGFIMKKFIELKTGKNKWSEILREDIKLMEEDRKCAYCGAKDNLTKEHVLPISINPKCPVINEIHNLVWACKKCNSSKNDRDVFEWYEKEKRNEIPRLVEGKYLKLIYKCHECRGTLDSTDINMDGEINVMDLGAIFKKPCTRSSGKTLD
jgi:HNH endonuclease